MGTASLWGGFGNGDSSGGVAAVTAVTDADRQLQALDDLAARLTVQASFVRSTQTYLLPDQPDSTDKQDLRLMAVEIRREQDETIQKRTALSEARRQVAESPDYGGGGLMFGLGTLGIVPALIAGLVALVAAVVAWVAHVWDKIDARQARLAEIRLTDNSRRADLGLPPLPATPGEGGVLAGLSDVIGKAGWVVAAIFLGPPLLRALLGGGRKRHAT